MSYLATCLAVFVAAYALNLFYVSVLFHRGLAHGAVKLKPALRWWAIHSGNWVTGIDPKAWACMHRMHHQYSDTAKDPHSPWNQGVLGVMLGQLHSYERALVGLQRGNETYLSVVRDLDFPVNVLNRKKIWWIPYLLHLAIALAIAIGFNAWLLGAAYWFGIMSHPVQGWMVNALAHRFGYQNFDNGDQSRNNTLIAWLVFGEGFQNNHHAQPRSPKFSVKWFEFDSGYLMCLAASWLGWLELERENKSLAPAPLHS
jgi:stearoyl-CoA desaturase (delta-9 desaturase)